MALVHGLRRLARYAPKAKRLAEDNAGKIAENVSKATDFVDEKTHGRYTDTLAKVDTTAAEFAEKQGQAPARGSGGDAAGPETDDAQDATPPQASGSGDQTDEETGAGEGDDDRATG